MHESVREINLNLSEAEDLEGAKGDYHELTQPAMHVVFKVFHELKDVLLEIEEDAANAAMAKSAQIKTTVMVVATASTPTV